MLNFFRKIRQKLLSDSNFSKYLIYAIGEIILVVIGILIALQINNWNTERVNRSQEIQYLKSLKTDFLETKINLESTLERQERTVEYCKLLIKEMRQKNLQIQPDSLGEYLYRGAFSYWRVEPVSGTYDALIGSGNITLITNQKLIQYLAKFSSEVSFGFEDEQMAVDLTSNLVKISSDYSYNVFPQSLYFYLDWESQLASSNDLQDVVRQHMSNDSFLSALIMKTGLENNRLDYQTALKKLTEDILEELDRELDLR
ncbi:MAG: hypothetical protein JJ895_00580 [Balneolaceae bacterium]|nr:hypothetical protein [Balneolaceae bacterium]